MGQGVVHIPASNINHTYCMWSEVELTCYYMNLFVSDLQRVIIGATYKRDDKQRQPTCWAEDSHVSIVYLYMSCVKAKNTIESLLTDIGQCCKEMPLTSKALWRHRMCCSSARQQLSAYFTEKFEVTCSSVWL